jgi:D-alanyl-D-alanine carboxypeptidase
VPLMLSGQAIDPVQAKLDSLCKAANYPGISVAVAYANGKVKSYTSGYADTAKHIKLTANSLLLQGSVGKTYVAAIAMQLISGGKIKLQDKASQYLGNETWFHRLPNAADITIEMLMKHTSGIMRYEFKEAFTKDLTAKPYKVWQPVELLSYIFDEKPAFKAGENWEYADTNYIILGMIIEKITGKTYYSLMQKQLLDKFKLRDTHPSNKIKLPGLVQGYAGIDNAFGNQSLMIKANGEMVVNPQFEWTGGGIYSTTADLAKWCKLLYEGKAFDPALLPVILNGVPAKMLGANTTYGLGVIIKQSAAFGMYYGHSGFFPGYLTEMYYFPKYKMAIVVQTNSSDFKSIRKSPHRILLDIGALVLK